MVSATKVRNVATISLPCTDVRKFPIEMAGDEIGDSSRQKEGGKGNGKPL